MNHSGLYGEYHYHEEQMLTLKFFRCLKIWWRTDFCNSYIVSWSQWAICNRFNFICVNISWFYSGNSGHAQTARIHIRVKFSWNWFFRITLLIREASYVQISSIFTVCSCHKTHFLLVQLIFALHNVFSMKRPSFLLMKIWKIPLMPYGMDVASSTYKPYPVIVGPVNHQQLLGQPCLAA